MAEKGNQCVPVSGETDFRQITGTFDVISYQYSGAKKRCAKIKWYFNKFKFRFVLPTRKIVYVPILKFNPTVYL